MPHILLVGCAIAFCVITFALFGKIIKWWQDVRKIEKMNDKEDNDFY